MTPEHNVGQPRPGNPNGGNAKGKCKGDGKERKGVRNPCEPDACTADLTGITYDDGGVTPAVALTYNRFGALATVADALGTRTFTYDLDHMLLTSEAMTGLINKTLTRSHSLQPPFGRATGISIGTEFSSGYHFDGVGRLERVTGPGLPTEGAAYTFLADSDLVESTAYGDPGNPAATIQRGFEDHRDLVSFVENAWSATPVSRHEYVNDGLGRRKSEVRSGPGFATGDHFRLYSYNDRSELTVSRRYAGTDISDTTNPHPTQWFQFAFDPIGNRREYIGDGVEDAKVYIRNNVNQYTSTQSPNETFSYDLDGNMTLDAKFEYDWDGENN